MLPAYQSRAIDLAVALATIANGGVYQPTHWVERVETVNGDVNLYLPDNDGFSLEYHRVNGDVRSDFDLQTSLNDKNGIAVYLGGGDRQYKLTTVNGDLRIYRR